LAGSAVAADILVDDGATNSRAVASNVPQSGNVWNSIAQSFTAQDPRILFGFRLKDSVSSLPHAGASIIYNLYAGENSYSTLLASKTVVFPSVVAAGSRSVFGDVGFVDADFSNVALVLGEKYTVEITVPPGALPATGADTGLAVWTSLSNPYGGGRFFFPTGYDNALFSAQDMLFRVTAVPGPVASAAKSADFNGDGRSDILWRNAVTGENYLYPMDGTTILGGEAYLRTVADLNWKIAGVGDFDGDGKADILWRNNASGENYIYFMDGTAIKPGEGYIRTVADQNWQVAGIGDFDGDGKADILWRNAVSGENYLYPMNGLAILGTEGYLRTVADTTWQIVAVAGFDGDGKADILWRNASSGENYLYPMDGTAIKPGEGFLRTVADLNWKIVGVGDFDGDGKADVVWRNSASGENYLYPMDGIAIKATEGYLRTVSDLAWQIVAVGDYDGDGKSDLLWRNSSTGQNYLYPMDGTAIKPAEGYLRTVPVGNWAVAGVAGGAGGGAPPPTANIPRFLYSSLFTNSVYAYRINATTGALTAISGSPFSTGGSLDLSFSIDPGGKFAYVANQHSHNVSAFSINATTGALTAITGSPIAAGTEPLGAFVHPGGKFAYVPNLNSNSVSAYTIDTTSGALAPIAGSPFPGVNGPNGVSIDAPGKFAYVGNSGSNTVSAFSIDAGTGALAAIAGSPFVAGTNPVFYFGPGGKFAYTANFISSDISVFSIDAASGALAPIAGSPFAAGSSPYGLAFHPSGKFAYVANYASNNVLAFAVDATTGALTPIAGSPFSQGTSVGAGLTFDPAGKFLYAGAGVGGAPSSSISAYAIDPTTGALTPIAGSPLVVGPGPVAVQIEPSGKFAYVKSSAGISAFSFDGATGALTPIAGSPFPGGGFGIFFYGSAAEE
jgi:6-phosphogluconolactonase (cycloisomerase 2 family)